MKLRIFIFIFIMCALAFTVPIIHAGGRDGIKVESTGATHAVVRVPTDGGRYLMLPVQDDGSEARVRVLADGRADREMVLRPANTSVDYYVPFDLEPYRGSKLALLVDTKPEYVRDYLRPDSSYMFWDSMYIAETFVPVNAESKYRPAFHHTPQYGWMNDPNGMFWHDGIWHLYYQWNPYGSKWQNMTWGHSTSADLVHWTPQPTAIEPNGLGAVFSGSCVVDHDNVAGFGRDAVIAFYTSAGEAQTQSLAYSTDGGVTFNIYDANPIITLPTEARDPNVFYHEPTDKWVMLLAHAVEGEMLILNSDNLREWTVVSAFGKGAGAHGGVWECPDLMELSDPKTGTTKWMLLCNINPGGPFGGSATQYFIGEFDGTTFTPDLDAAGNVPTKWLDYGKDNYASVSFSGAPDGRRTILGWMSNWEYANDVPTMQFRSANTVARDLSLFHGSDGRWYVASTPVAELEAMRDARMASVSKVSVGDKPRSYSLPKDGVCEIVMTIEAANADNVEISLSNVAGEAVIMSYNPAEERFSFDRTRSGLVDFGRSFTDKSVAPTFGDKGTVELRIFIDRSSIEVFGDNGRFVLTNLAFPTAPYTTLSLQANGGKAIVKNLNIYSIKQ